MSTDTDAHQTPEAPPETAATAAAPAVAAGDDPAASAAAPEPDLSPEATGARLAALFPALFVGPDGRGEWKAIKLRIHADIQARAPGEFSKRALGIFFSRYTTTTPYLKALAAEGAQRVDLDGQPAGEIAEEHRNAANEELARRQAIVAERREAYRKAAAAQRQASRPAPAEGEAQAPRPPRPPRPERADDKPPRHRPHEKQVAAERRDRPPAPRDARRPARHDGPPREHRHAEAREPQREAPPVSPADPAQRERALLLRAFESSPLSKANFCALKRMSEAELDTLLAQAREERSGRKA